MEIKVGVIFNLYWGIDNLISIFKTFDLIELIKRKNNI